MSAATAKALVGLGALATVPFSIAYIFTADHTTLKFGTICSSQVENRFKVFDDRAKDSLPAEKRRHRSQRMQEEAAHYTKELA